MGRMLPIKYVNALVIGLACSLAGCERPNDSQPPVVESSNGNSILEKVCITAAELLGVAPDQVKADTSLGDLKADELDFVELIMELEEQFNVTIPDDVAEEMMGTENWQQGLAKITMSKLARTIEEQQRRAGHTKIPAPPKEYVEKPHKGGLGLSQPPARW